MIFSTFLIYILRINKLQIQCHDVVLEDSDVVKAIIEYINRTAIEVLVLGAAAKGGLLRYESLYASIFVLVGKGPKTFGTEGVVDMMYLLNGGNYLNE